jgi:hypothetical protein
MVSWVVTPYNFVSGYQHFEGHMTPVFSESKLEAACSFETFVTTSNSTSILGVED